MVQLPFTTDAEYRGKSPAGEFTNDAGEVVPYSDGLKFEVPLAGDDVSILRIRQSRLDEASDFDTSALKKGDMVRLHLVINVPERDGERGGFRPIACERVGADGKVVTLAKAS